MKIIICADRYLCTHILYIQWLPQLLAHLVKMSKKGIIKECVEHYTYMNACVHRQMEE